MASRVSLGLRLSKTNYWPDSYDVHQKDFASTDLNISKSSLSDEVKLVQSRERMSASDDSADADVDGQVEGAKVALADVDGQGLLGGLQLGLGHGC